MSVLNICGLEYRVVYASAEDVPELVLNEAFCQASTNTIYIRNNLPRSRSRDARAHEIGHAFLEGSGIGSFLSDRVRGDYDKFEETLIRLFISPFLRLVDDNGSELIADPPAKAASKQVAKVGTGRAKKASR